MDNLGDLTVKVRSSRMTFQEDKVRKPLLAVSGMINKRNIVVFDGSGFCVREAVTGVQGRIPLHAKNGVFVLRTWNLKQPRRRAKHQAEQAWT